MKTLNNLVGIVLLLPFIFLVSLPVVADEQPSGTINFVEKEFRLILGGASGHGTLHFQDKDYAFKISGITAGGLGIAKVHAKGNVYGLNDIADFPGTYVEASVGLSVTKGKGGYWYKNDNGVSLHIKTSQEGLELALGVGGMKIELAK